MTAPLALTCGEPAGIGPEIAVAAWRALRDDIPMVWLGDPRHLPKGTPVSEVDDVCAAPPSPKALSVLPMPFAAPNTLGSPDLNNAQGVVDVIKRAVALTQSGQTSAVVTAPIHKKVLQDGAGFAFPGHTEFLAHLGGVERSVMMLASPALRVVPATIHVALSDVPKVLTPDVLRDTIAITAQALKKQFGLTAPRIAVAGLNPHAGEGGAMGREELEWIAKVVGEFAKSGLQIFGPVSADTMFHAAARKTYDVAICMYHDQALIPIKTLDFDKGVNVTLGLPFIRTSPDHGTAFDIAGTGKANPTSMIEACKLAWTVANA